MRLEIPAMLHRSQPMRGSHYILSILLMSFPLLGTDIILAAIPSALCLLLEKPFRKALQ